jgi:hypothetical protein
MSNRRRRYLCSGTPDGRGGPLIESSVGRSRYHSSMNLVAVVGLFIVGIFGLFVMAAGAIAGSAVHVMPSIGTMLAGCAISTVGLGFCLAGVAVAKSKLAVRVAELPAVLAVLYGFFHSLMTIVLESGNAATLGWGIYVGIISVAAALFIRQAHLRASSVA